MSTLPNFPIVSQLSAVTSDGKPSENAQFDCVPASIGACMLWLAGKSAWDSTINPDKFKDTAYSDTYTGGTSAASYVNVCKSMGFHLYSVDASDTAQTIASARQLLAENKPAIFTELDPYVDTNLPQYAGWTHVCVFYADDGNGLTAMDPYIGKPVYKSYATWESLLRANQLWTLEKLMVLPSNWHLSADGQTLYCKNHIAGQPDVPVQFGFKAFVQPLLESGKWPNEDVFLAPQEYKAQLEYSNAELGDGDQILSLFGRMLCYPHNPTGGVAHLKNTVVLEYTGVELNRWRDQFVQLYKLYQADEEKLKSQPAAPGIDPAKVNARLQALDALFKQGEQLVSSPL